MAGKASKADSCRHTPVGGKVATPCIAILQRVLQHMLQGLTACRYAATGRKSDQIKKVLIAVDNSCSGAMCEQHANSLAMCCREAAHTAAGVNHSPCRLANICCGTRRRQQFMQCRKDAAPAE
jgi:hypothetical protein